MNICIAVGHGRSVSSGYDSGAVSRDKKHHEFKIAREIARYAAEYLECDLMNYEGELYLVDRINEINKRNYDFVAEIHLNAGGGTGTEVYYYHGSKKGKSVAQVICKNISEALAVKNRGSKIRLGKNGQDYFGFIRQTKPCAVLIETAFIDNEADLAKISTQQGMRACGIAIGRAIESALMNGEKGFEVQVTCPSLNIRKGPGMEYQITAYLRMGNKTQIDKTDSSGRWGRLSDGRGWINIMEKYVRRG